MSRQDEEIVMKAESAMAIGAAVGVMGLIACFVTPDAGILAFGGGALFGKGYGIWESRRESRGPRSCLR